MKDLLWTQTLVRLKHGVCRERLSPLSATEHRPRRACPRLRLTAPVASLPPWPSSLPPRTRRPDRFQTLRMRRCRSPTHSRWSCSLLLERQDRGSTACDSINIEAGAFVHRPKHLPSQCGLHPRARSPAVVPPTSPTPALPLAVDWLPPFPAGK